MTDPEHDRWMTAPIEELVDAAMDAPPTRETMAAERAHARAVEKRLERKAPKPKRRKGGTWRRA